jgi:hypothetical protein
LSDPTLIDLVNGVVDEAALAEIGIEVAFQPDGAKIEAGPSSKELRPSVAEVAAGYLAAWAQSSETLQKWARLILGVTNIDLAALEDDPEGDALLNAIWDAADGSPSGIDVATRLAGR